MIFLEYWNLLTKRFTFKCLTNWTNLIFYTLLLSCSNVREIHSSPVSYKNLIPQFLDLCVDKECVTPPTNSTTSQIKTEIKTTEIKNSFGSEQSTELEIILNNGIESEIETSENSNKDENTPVTWPGHFTLFPSPDSNETNNNENVIITSENPNDYSAENDTFILSGTDTNATIEVISSTILVVNSLSITPTSIANISDEGKKSGEKEIFVTSVLPTSTQNLSDNVKHTNSTSTFHATFFSRTHNTTIPSEYTQNPNATKVSNDSIIDEYGSTRKSYTIAMILDKVNKTTEADITQLGCKVIYPNGTIVIQPISDVLANAAKRTTVSINIASKPITSYDVTTEVYEPVLLTDQYGKPITEANGGLTYVDECGRPITQSHGNHMFTDKNGYPVTDKNGNVIYVDKSGKPVTDCNGMAVYTDSSGKPIVDSYGNPIYTDSCRKPITDSKGKAVSTDSAGRPVYTDSSGNPLTDADGNNLYTDKNGRPVTDSSGRNIYTDGCGKAVFTYKDGKPITNKEGKPIYTDIYGNPLFTPPMSSYTKSEDNDTVFDYEESSTETYLDYEDIVNGIPADKMKTAEKMTNCNEKILNNSTNIMCACNKTYCDKFLPIRRVPKGQYLWFSSTKSGLRFNKKIGEFAKESPIKRSPDYFTIDMDTKMQEIIGFGATFTELASEVIRKLSSQTQTHLLESYFGYFGIRYTLGRVPIGCSEFSPEECTYMDHPQQPIDKFTLTRHDLKYKIPVILKASEMTNNEIKLIGTAWTAPKWMKTVCSLKKGGFLRRDYLSVWAKYHIQFLQGYASKKIKFWGLSTGNEATDADNKGMGWSPYQLQQWVTYHLVPELRNSSYNDTLILVFDDNREYLPFYLKWFFENFEGKKYKDLQCMRVNEAYDDVAGIALHWYTDTATNLKYLDYIHELYPDKFLLYTEASCRPLEMASWDCAERYALDIISNLNNWVVGWMDLNLALNVRGGPNWRKETASASIIVNEKHDEFYKQPSYYAIGHFSKFILPNSHRIKITPTELNNITAVAVKRPDKGIAIVFYNKGVLQENVTFVVDQHQISIQIEAKSINSILFWN